MKQNLEHSFKANCTGKIRGLIILNLKIKCEMLLLYTSGFNAKIIFIYGKIKFYAKFII